MSAGIIALQCFPLGLLCHRRTVRSNRYVYLSPVRPSVFLAEEVDVQTYSSSSALTKNAKASLRIQTTEANKSEFPSVSPERFVASMQDLVKKCPTDFGFSYSEHLQITLWAA